MIGQTISHYPALRDLPLFWIPPIGGIPGSGTARRDKIIKKLGEGGLAPACIAVPAGRRRNSHSKMDE
jgi:hypothetical protein